MAMYDHVQPCMAILAMPKSGCPSPWHVKDCTAKSISGDKYCRKCLKVNIIVQAPQIDLDTTKKTDPAQSCNRLVAYISSQSDTVIIMLPSSYLRLFFLLVRSTNLYGSHCMRNHIFHFDTRNKLTARQKCMNMGSMYVYPYLYVHRHL